MAERALEERLITAEEFWSMPTGEGQSELVEGRVVEMPPVGPEHGATDMALALKLGAFVRERQLGRVYLNTGFLLGNGPDVVRAPDQAFVSKERLKAHPPPDTGYWPLAPDLAVEIVSPNDTADQIAEKVGDYLNAGVRQVWVIYPRRKYVQVHAPGEPIQVVAGDSVLSGGEIMPGFELHLAELWELVQD